MLVHNWYSSINMIISNQNLYHIIFVGILIVELLFLYDTNV
jgi:hypothetical protein